MKGAVRYRVSLKEVDRTTVWSGTADAPSATLPAEVLAKLVPAKTLTWQVLAVDANNAVIADSGSQRFRIEKPSNQ